MPSFKEVWRHFGLILELDFCSLLCCSSEMPNLWRRRPKDGSLQVSRKAKDGSLRPFHVQAHAEFSFG